jgi:uncharacterized membrane protein
VQTTFSSALGEQFWVAVILGILMLGALGRRLSVVWQRLSQMFKASTVRLVGEEIGGGVSNVDIDRNNPL